MDHLLELQELDLAIDRLSARLQTLESQAELREARADLAQAESRLGELRLAIDAVSVEQGRLESDVDSLDRKISAERARLFDGSVANPKELQSIEAEVQSLTARKARVEDLVLEQMERREGLEGRLDGMDTAQSDARRLVDDLEQGSARELVEVEESLREKTGKRDKLAAELDPELLELYESLRRQKKGVGAAALVDAVCQGCHQKLSPVYLEGLKKADGVRRCEYCRRILVFA